MSLLLSLLTEILFKITSLLYYVFYKILKKVSHSPALNPHSIFFSSKKISQKTTLCISCIKTKKKELIQCIVCKFSGHIKCSGVMPRVFFRDQWSHFDLICYCQNYCFFLIIKC